MMASNQKEKSDNIDVLQNYLANETINPALLKKSMGFKYSTSRNAQQQSLSV